MAGSCKSGPLGCEPEVQNLNDGTHIRALSPRPGPIGTKTSSIAGIKGKPSFVSFNMPATRKKAVHVDLQILRQGNQGKEVQKLQRLLNVRLIPSQNLAIDGIFGLLTHQAVLQYQKGVAITADGIVGKQTWYHLLKGDKVTVPQAVVPKTSPAISKPGAAPKTPAAVQPPKIASLIVTATGIWEWPLEDKFAEVLRRTGPKLPGSMRHEFEALLTPTSLGIMAGTLVFWAGSHAFVVGEWVDVVLLAGGAFFLGMAVFDVAGELGDFLVVTSYATDEKELDEAASHLARAIAIMGIAAFIALLAKIAKSRGGKGGDAEVPAESTSPKQQSNINNIKDKSPLSKSNPSVPPPGLHNQEFKGIDATKFKTVRKVDIKNLSADETIAVKALEEQGWTPKKIKEVLSSGDNFKTKDLQPGDKLYGFNTAGHGKDIQSSAYWLDEVGYQDVKSKYFKEGVWDKEGVKNYLALPCYNKANAIDMAEVTQPTTVVEATIGKATELIQYIDNGSGYSTELMGKIMGGGGAQVTVAPAALKLLPGL